MHTPPMKEGPKRVEHALAFRGNVANLKTAREQLPHQAMEGHLLHLGCMEFISLPPSESVQERPFPVTTAESSQNR